MIVYGDHEIEIALSEVVQRLWRRVEMRTRVDLDEARVQLVLAGQIQQAVEDDGHETLCETSRALTATAARTFIAARASPCAVQDSLFLTAARRDFDRAIQRAGDRILRIRTPEGFAWYGLMPDAYAQSAEAWSDECGEPTSVLVVGIRSIGTTLAAVVADVLKTAGHRVVSTTVRPGGHPFARTTMLADDLADVARAIVVDEGPGLSGSSMASVATALARQGLPARAISFFAGHANGPGPHAAPEVMAWWRAVRVYAVAWENVAVHPGRSAASDLVSSYSDLTGEVVEEPPRTLGGGAWTSGADRPLSLAPRLERPKLMISSRSGRRVLLKFAGFAMACPDQHGELVTTAEAQRQRLDALAKARLTVAPLGLAHGYIVLPWVDGRRLSVADLDGALLARIARQISASASVQLAPGDPVRAFARLRSMLVANARELLGDDAAGAVERASDRLEACAVAFDGPGYGDGRLAPCEWIETPAGVLKMDAGGHEHDHTVVGRQPVLWDIAGASVEWDLDADQQRTLAGLCGIAPEPALTGWYRAAYAAFHAGIAALCDQHLARDEYAARLRGALAIFEGAR